jgi:hypothetical protein
VARQSLSITELSPKIKVNQEVVVNYTPKLSKTILWTLWFHSIGRIYLLASAIACLILAPVMILDRTNIIILLFVIFGFLLYLLKQSESQRESSMSVAYQVQTFRFLESHLELEVNQQQSRFSWNTLNAVYKYPNVWLIEFSTMTGYFALPTKKLNRDVKKMIILKLKQQQHNTRNI